MFNYQFFALLGIFLTFISSNAMEPALPAETPHIIVANDTVYKLKIVYQAEGKPLFETAALPSHSKIIIENPSLITLFKASPSGELKQHTQIWEPENIAHKISAFALEHPNHHVEVTIKALEPISRRVEGMPVLGGVLKWAAQPVEKHVAFVDYSYAAKPVRTTEGIKPASIVPQSRVIMDAFPQVKATHAAGGEIFARHFLGVPKDANKDSVEKEYNDLKTLWEAEKLNYPSNTQYVNKVLEILATARDVLIDGIKLKEVIFNDILTQPRYPQG